jgi:Ca-activated chloride channel family protein
MSFAAPYLLLGLLAVPLAVVAYFGLERRREQRAAGWANPALVPNLVKRPGPRIRHLPAALFLVAVALLLVAFARPEASLNSEREGATVVLTIDTSGSMATPDIKLTRLLAARTVSLTFLRELPSKYRVALEIFTDHPAVLVPPTYDRTKAAAERAQGSGVTFARWSSGSWVRWPFGRTARTSRSARRSSVGCWRCCCCVAMSLSRPSG